MEMPHRSVAMQVMLSAVMLVLAVGANLAAGQSSSGSSSRELYQVGYGGSGGNNNNGRGNGRDGGGRGGNGNGGPGKPDCKRNGGMCGDPRIVGGDGVMFYFHGRKNQDFCLVSDSDLHINAHFIGKRPEGRPRDFTWVQALGFVFASHTLTVSAKPVAKWDRNVDHLEFSYDGVAVEIDNMPMSSWTSADEQVTLERIGAANTVDVRIKEKMGVALSVVPISKKESDAHGYGIGDDDCFAHLDMQFRFHNLSSSVNGVLGQTYQPGYVNPTKRGVVMPIMGGADRFQSSSLEATDCKVSQYTATAIAAGSAMPSFNTECGSSSGIGGSGGILTCRR